MSRCNLSGNVPGTLLYRDPGTNLRLAVDSLPYVAGEYTDELASFRAFGTARPFRISQGYWSCSVSNKKPAKALLLKITRKRGFFQVTLSDAHRSSSHVPISSSRQTSCAVLTSTMLGSKATEREATPGDRTSSLCEEGYPMAKHVLTFLIISEVKLAKKRV